MFEQEQDIYRIYTGYIDRIYYYELYYAGIIRWGARAIVDLDPTFSLVPRPQTRVWELDLKT